MNFYLLFCFAVLSLAANGCDCGKGKKGCGAGLCCSYWGCCGSSTAHCGSGATQCVCDCNGSKPCIEPAKPITPTPTTPQITLQCYAHGRWQKTVVATTSSPSGYTGLMGDACTMFRASVNTGKVYYKVHFYGNGKTTWSNEYGNNAVVSNNYKAIDGLMIRVTGISGYTLNYQVHTRYGKWWSYVTGYSATDYNNGYAGSLGNNIDGIRAYFKKTSNDNGGNNGGNTGGNGNKGWFPMSVMQLTQIAYENYSHGDSMHIDCIGSTYAFAPFTGTVRVANKYSYGVFLFTSNDKVQMPNGKTDYLTVMFMHGESLYNVGSVVKRGTNFYKLSGWGNGYIEYGTHLDMGCRIGTHTSTAIVSRYRFFGNMHIYQCLYLNTKVTTSIINEGVAQRAVLQGGITSYKGRWTKIQE